MFNDSSSHTLPLLTPPISPPAEVVILEGKPKVYALQFHLTPGQPLAQCPLVIKEAVTSVIKWHLA